MVSRRMVVLGLLTYPSSVRTLFSIGQTAGADEQPFDQLIYPPMAALVNPEPFGYEPASEAQKARARKIVNETPKGRRPIDIAQSLVDRFYVSAPDLISQWPAPASWNPLIVDFFSATSTPANNDMIPWCAAFANWCIERSGRNGSRDASSQSFLGRGFKKTDDPQVGDLAVFTCYDRATQKSLGIGHVTFFKGKLPNNHITVVGGNQSGDGHSSIIREGQFATAERLVRRHVGGKYVVCTMKLNSYVKIV